MSGQNDRRDKMKLRQRFMNHAGAVSEQQTVIYQSQQRAAQIVVVQLSSSCSRDSLSIHVTAIPNFWWHGSLFLLKKNIAWTFRSIYMC